ncbi:hypothetical protein, partial [Lactiplantibacillus plantarum]|uniref:hypothetical protein n=1 Tax=Lactiplantibacillus plantarum TaxID=1590 RepID=UPI003F53E1B8
IRVCGGGSGSFTCGSRGCTTGFGCGPQCGCWRGHCWRAHGSREEARRPWRTRWEGRGAALFALLAF